MRILYVSSELIPYTPENTLSNAALELPRITNGQGNDVRIFMPRFGTINERRHQLHEVIRLSGMNMIVNDIDQPLIIKVASLPNDRMQVYFIDNEEYFKRKGIYEDKKTGEFYEDNDERAIFFTKGILETIKKLNWKPDVIHAQGWMSALMPLYLKTYYADDPFFNEIKIVYSLFDKPFEGILSDDMMSKIAFDKIDEKEFEHLKKPTFNNLLKVGIDHADVVVQGDEVLPDEIMDYIKKTDKSFKEYAVTESLCELYPSLCEVKD
ncbi:Glycogen synthase 1 [Candidatus Ornithobacterium hominis]|uniref:starch synthase n=1 Tax=Candidatus Ornithobacterium hominis TaxID=2497989 RepID=A0A383TTQ5_9FLAO|nr:glycogen/starch synthase [Candidatus Ornithobacterium hominis]MCT7903696.1 glycogen/starch synthase [Candidatus Ornithobacterium hominis]SZD71034.1 Glycogen synthase 1 [Candidatus Ornithobacterium hominis]